MNKNKVRTKWWLKANDEKKYEENVKTTPLLFLIVEILIAS